MSAAQGNSGRVDWDAVSSVLLIKLRSIGDTLLMTPCLQALKSFRPGVRITAVSEPLSAPVLEGHPLLDELIVTRQDFAARAGLVAGLRRKRFDVACNLHGGTTATLITALSGARYTAGYRGYRQSWMLRLRAPDPDVILGRSPVHSVEQQLALLNWTGVPWPEPGPKLSLAVSAELCEGMRRRLAIAGINQAGGFAVLSPAAAFESKIWPAASFAQTADYLLDRWNLQSVVIAGKGQEQIAQTVASTSRARPLVVTGLSLKELTGLISLSSLFVGNDSGPMHIAAALERPLVAIFGSSNPDVWHPWTESPSRVLKSGPQPISSIPVPGVTGAISEVLGPGPAGSHTADGQNGLELQ